MATKETYRVRKDWGDPKSQLGAYSILNNAIKTCEKGGSEYKVYNSKGEVVYPKEEEVKIDVSKVNTAAADPKKMWDYFKSKGLTDAGVAGLMGNLYAESGLKSCNLQGTYETKLGMTDAEYTAAVDAGTYTNFVKDSAGYGLAQWTYWSLKQDLYNYMKKLNKSIGDLEGQMEFLAYQLEKDYNAVWKTLTSAKTVLEASNAVLLKFERPADQSEAAQNKRASYGQKYYDSYAKKTSVIEPAVKEEGKQPITSTIEISKEGVEKKLKYSNINKPLICMQTQSSCYKGTKKMTIKGILWHSTGANNPDLKRYVQPSDNADDKTKMLNLLGVNNNKNDWNHIDRQAGMNAWIGKLKDGTITSIQTMPWDYRPWGCGSGSIGSCNDGWIQFEICEDNLANKNYFEAIYKEACELTAYLCKLYNLNPKGTVSYCGKTIPVILCHADAHKLGFGSNHGDIYHWFNKHGKNMDTVREDVAALLKLKEDIKIEDFKDPEIITQLYRVRKTWADEKSQIGAYANLDAAKLICDKAGKDYSVFNTQGIVIYPENKIITELKDTISSINSSSTQTFKIGDEVKLLPNAKYTSGQSIPKWVFDSKLYIREVRQSGNYVISTQKTGAVTGVVKADSVIAYTAILNNKKETSSFTPYLVRISADVLNVRLNPNETSKIVTQIKKNEIFTIVDKKNNWGKLKSGLGWICLDYTKKVTL